MKDIINNSRFPTFFLIGAAKAGTSSFYHYLKQHPQVYFPKSKEPCYFNDDNNYKLGIQSYLDTHYKKAGGYAARGDATPMLHRPEKVIPRLKDVFNKRDVRFIVILRDPVARAWSHYWHRNRTYFEKESFESALELEEKRIRINKDEWCGYFRDGLYAQQLERWFSAFSKDRFLIFLYEDILKDSTSVINKIFSFISVDPVCEVDTTRHENTAGKPRSEWIMKLLSTKSLLGEPARMFVPRHLRKRIKTYLRSINMRSGDTNPKMPAHIEMSLRKRYKNDIQMLSTIIDRDLKMWLIRNEVNNIE
ncbi:MAG: sulfotransferase [Candidatus Thorarchaeota archaeon]